MEPLCFHTWMIYTWFIIIHGFVINGLFFMHGLYINPYMCHIYMFKTCKRTSCMANGGPCMTDSRSMYAEFTWPKNASPIHVPCIENFVTGNYFHKLIRCTFRDVPLWDFQKVIFVSFNGHSGVIQKLLSDI